MGVNMSFMNELPLTGVKNARDLGGIMTADGKRIKDKKLIRSGALCGATGEDLRILFEDYDVKTVIDLRTARERKLMPNPCMPDISEIWNPLYMEDIQGLGVFKPDDTDILMNRLKSMFILDTDREILREDAAKQVRDMVVTDGFDPEASMARLYQKFVNNQIIQKQVKQFFSIIANRRGGAILWHCTAGKDRTGVITALLLHVLGVPKETIIANYELSAESSEDAVDFLLGQMFPGNTAEAEKLRSLAKPLFGAKTCYIRSFFDAVERDYVSVDNYLQKAIEIHVDNAVRLRSLYLD